MIDHHHRDREILVGVSVNSSKEYAADFLFKELFGDERWSGTVDKEELREVIRTIVNEIKWSKEESEEVPQVWFLFTW